MSNYRRVPSTETSGDENVVTTTTSPQRGQLLVNRSNSSTGSTGSASAGGGGGGGLQPQSQPSSPASASSTQQHLQQQSPFIAQQQQPQRSQSLASQNSQSSATQQHQHPRRKFSDRLQDKVVAFLWVIVAVLVALASDFWNVMVGRKNTNNNNNSNSRQPLQPLLQLAGLAIVVNILLCLYLSVYLPRVKGLVDSSAWQHYCPRVVPLIVILGIVSTLLLIRATWPVWGFLAPLILGTQAMGALFALHFVPCCLTC